MADVYWIGVFLGLGVGIGVLLAGLLAGSRAGVLVAVALAGTAGFVLGIFLGDEPEAAAAAIGGIFGVMATAELVRGALRRGGARGGTALIVAGAAGVVAILAFVPLLAIRTRRRTPDRYEGLRTLARD